MDVLKLYSEASLVSPTARDLTSHVIDEDGAPRIMPAKFYEETTSEERSLLCLRNGLYCLPTIELVERLRELIDGRPAIEIGAGNGALAKALGIAATDNRMQELPHYKRKYDAIGQPTVRYGAHVERMDASVAVKRYKPKVVIGAWVTHRYDPRRHAAGGNEMGIVEEAIIKACDLYVMVGNEHVHRNKSIWALEHSMEYPTWLYSRSHNGSRDFIATWCRR